MILYVLAGLGLLGDVVAIWLAIHAHRHEKANNTALRQILEELHQAVIGKNECPTLTPLTPPTFRLL